MMKRVITVVAAVLSAVLASATPALAKPPPDPHMPIPQTGHCPGGRGMKPLQFAVIYCDGVPYADGSHWRYNQFAVIPDVAGMNDELRSMYGLQCVIADEVARSSLAPPGGCDGAV